MGKKGKLWWAGEQRINLLPASLRLPLLPPAFPPGAAQEKGLGMQVPHGTSSFYAADC